jgi:hypothetical protein
MTVTTEGPPRMLRAVSWAVPGGSYDLNFKPLTWDNLMSEGTRNLST